MGRLFPMSYFLPVNVGTFTKGLGFADLATDVGTLVLFVPALVDAGSAPASQAGALSDRPCAVSRTSSGSAPKNCGLHGFSLLGLVIYSLSLALIAQAQSNSQEVAMLPLDSWMKTIRNYRAESPTLSCRRIPGASIDRRT
jgi:hypothetical protein